MREITINRNDAGQRLDKFINKFMPKLPKGMLYKGLRKNCVRINGKHVKDGSVFLNEGDILKLYFSDEFFESENTFKSVKYDLDIVYEDENILIINKKSGTVVHADDRGSENTLIDQVQSYLFEKGEYRPNDEHSFSPSLCNRLDRNTEGLIIVAKNAESLRILNEKIKNKEVRKIYLCAVMGHMSGKGEMSAYLTRHEKKVSVSDKMTDGAKEVKLLYNVLSQNEASTLVEVELLTGRTHQIRAQFAHIGHPLVGDIKYGGSRSENYQELVSHRLIFDFKTDAGILNYLHTKDFSISSDLEKMFSLTNS